MNYVITIVWYVVVSSTLWQSKVLAFDEQRDEVKVNW